MVNNENETSFYALMSRMRYISRWGLMRSSIPENIQEHSHEVAVYAHALGLIRRDVFGQACDAEHLAVLALYHDASEILTGDLPTPIKYHDPYIRIAYKEVEKRAAEKLVAMLPECLRASYAPVLTPEGEEERLVKAADKLSLWSNASRSGRRATGSSSPPRSRPAPPSGPWRCRRRTGSWSTACPPLRKIWMNWGPWSYDQQQAGADQ